MPVDIKILEYYFWKQYTIKHKIKKVKKQLALEPIAAKIDEYNRVLINSNEEDFSKQTFTVFDLETTGFFPELGDEIISIGAVKIKNNKVIYADTFYKLVKPLSKVSKLTKQLTGLTNTELNQSSYFPEILYDFLEFSEESILVAHPATFDIPFLRSSIKAWNLPYFSPISIDSHSLANSLHPSQNNYLDHLIKKYHIKQRKRHHALNDSIMTAEIFEKLLEECKKNSSSLTELITLNNL
ncbi:3'-5' exonuclease [Litchfieldia salsa]|uniref:DNA polymerase-3 subunit epsilon/DNA polymerase-3 subunit alpha n=1 Tax=Litchfieldia salsa TaxID=930152 RepID=A0A1H0TBP5_9BACI|nr:3'-5' exonuclease [Litchfieldia salsa]SDP51483.1 DNA polymerase-3 subunit epsilon/DNA polymerase-3 subunit alpha [Litchfieldia salsa]